MEYFKGSFCLRYLGKEKSRVQGLIAIAFFNIDVLLILQAE